MRDSLTAIGGGSTMVGAICLLAGAHSEHVWLLDVGKVLVALGVLMFAVRLYRLWKA